MRSVVVVLPASMCAMIPMLRVFSRENFLGIDQDPVSVWGMVAENKNGPLGPTRAAGLVGPVRVVICSRSPSSITVHERIARKRSPRPWRLGDYSRGIRANWRPSSRRNGGFQRLGRASGRRPVLLLEDRAEPFHDLRRGAHLARRDVAECSLPA